MESFGSRELRTIPLHVVRARLDAFRPSRPGCCGASVAVARVTSPFRPTGLLLRRRRRRGRGRLRCLPFRYLPKRGRCPVLLGRHDGLIIDRIFWGTRVRPDDELWRCQFIESSA